MKIGLLTYHHSFNYGAVMQSYATVKALQMLGHDVEFINIRQDEHRSLKHLFFLPKTIQFNRFIKKFYPKETELIRSYEELCKKNFKYDCLMVGSDQTWNPDISGDLCMAYFLGFGNDNVKRVSYASSFGIQEWPTQRKVLIPAIKAALDKFDAISVREKKGVELLETIFKKKGELVVDPTMLHTDYKEIIPDVKPSNEICCYLLNRTTEQLDFARQLGYECGDRPVMISNAYPFKGFRYVYPPSIEGWLKHISGAKIVVTDSFHGVVFSLLYHRNFIVVTPFTNKLSRLQNLIEMLGLENRFFTNMEEALQSRVWKEEIDYKIVDASISRLREKSWEYLKNNLS